MLLTVSKKSMKRQFPTTLMSLRSLSSRLSLRHLSPSSFFCLPTGICIKLQIHTTTNPPINPSKDDEDCMEGFSNDATLKSSRVDFRPRRIILVRHGESQGNVDQSAYVTTADWRITLTSKGRAQAREAGEKLRDLLTQGNENGRVVFYVSPYERTWETLEGIKTKLDPNSVIAVREEPRISEQQIGNFQNVDEVIKAKGERHRFGRFFYRFPSGEAGLDVYSRVSSFISTLVRDCHQYKHNGYDLSTMNIVIVTHGLALRLFLMRWFQFSVAEFEASENPGNAQLVVLNKKTGVAGHRWYELDNDARVALNLPRACGIPKNVILHSLRHQDDL